MSTATDSAPVSKKSTWPAAVSGLLFGVGLVLSGLADPARVLAFLTLAPGWDPSLMVVMGTAVTVATIGIALVNRRGRSLLGGDLPAVPTGIDRNLVAGAALFGLGWGLAGYCPGPAVVAAGMGQWPAWVFVPAMFAGAALVNRFRHDRSRRQDD